MRICIKCKNYTLKEICSKCTAKTKQVRTLKYTPESKYSKYRRLGLFEERKKRGLL
ncbi:MAG TPA: nucleolar RNA-binding Nop10p family protein [Candidatus Woesearchaeota archaeon]|jgi:H/ACA ribonucleoprotein complex subunit 3|nr:nucleolar RNA-binding Nop10p family protein [Candidatus Woesearchaeota archaeon]